MKKWLLHIGVFVVVVGLAGALVMVAGIVPIKASSGHWSSTRRLLSFSMARSVATNSMGVETPPDLDDPAKIMKGAGHFHVGCAPCHGSPEWQRPRIAQGLTPAPPELSSKVGAWTPAQLFYIVKHGVKFTGMPAFPSQERDDEVWSVVAFLLQLPAVDKKEYRRLVYAEAEGPTEETPRVVASICANCHGFDGNGRGEGAFPRLAGLPSEYLSATLQAYTNGERHSGIMEPLAARLEESDIEEIASYYSGQPLARSGSPAAEEATVARGRKIANEGLPKQNVGACIACHPLDREVHNPNYPFLAGQPADYLSLQIELFKNRRRGGTEFSKLMHPISDGLEPRQKREVAAFYESAEKNANR